MRAAVPALSAAAVVMSALLVGCAEQPPAVAPTVPAAPQPDASGDGVLRFGTLFSSTGAYADYSGAQVAGVELAVRDLNAAGGVGGRPVEVVHRNAADGGQPATDALAQLIEKGVDVVLGPTATSVAKSLLADPAIDGVLLLTPAFVDAGRADELVPTGLFRTVADAGTPTRADDDFLGRLTVVDPGLTDTALAAEAYDATLAAALAAVAAGDDGAASVAWALPTVTTGGYGCTVLGVCLEALAASIDIDYAGVSGPFDIPGPGNTRGSASAGRPPGAAGD
ncbi:ABC transporter substrate-binding protein [Lysobacter korlensis]|uniref:ABC transporter substrate-binding protein n=1 Tax=Lysobacter korlensis TaxID=553636 RepID=A0ABV6RUX4_9GAMM